MKSTAWAARALILSLIGVSTLLFMASNVSAAAPIWWTERAVLNPSESPNDYGPLVHGQLKHLALAAFLEMEANLPGGAGPEVTALVRSWNPFASNAKNYARVNIGQLKAVAKPFYVRLKELGYISAFPWTQITTDDQSYAQANVGQAKNLFNFHWNILSPSLVGRWGFGEQTGSVTQDLTVSDNDGNLRNGAAWSSTGPGGRKAIILDGPTDDLEIVSTSDEELDLGVGSFSVSAWFKTTATGTSRLISKGNHDWANGISLGMGHTGNGKVTVGLGAGGAIANSILFSTVNTFNDGSWHYVVGVINRGAGVGSIYIDGVAQNLEKFTGTAGNVSGTSIDFSATTGLNASSTGTATLGSQGGVGEVFVGELADMRVYRGPLDGAAVAAIYAGQDDSDGDGISEADELAIGLDPNNNDAADDLDGDGAINSRDADPNDPAVGQLSISITSPLNNSVLP